METLTTVHRVSVAQRWKLKLSCGESLGGGGGSAQQCCRKMEMLVAWEFRWGWWNISGGFILLMQQKWCKYDGYSSYVTGNMDMVAVDKV